MNKRFSKVLLVVVIVIMSGVVFGVISKRIPEGYSPQKADSLAVKVMQSLGKEAWDSTDYVSWSFPGGHHYEWFKSKDSVIVQWKEYRAEINLDNQSGVVYENDKLVANEKQAKLTQKAITFFNNDSFWLSAHFKMMDEGTSRELVDLKDDLKGLKVSYSSGGSTPGDTYLWIIKDNLPIAWKMWVSIIPFGGVKTTWEDWKRTQNGVSIAMNHKLMFLNIRIQDLVIH
jgi:hypothetical protein